MLLGGPSCTRRWRASASIAWRPLAAAARGARCSVGDEAGESAGSGRSLARLVVHLQELAAVALITTHLWPEQRCRLLEPDLHGARRRAELLREGLACVKGRERVAVCAGRGQRGSEFKAQSREGATFYCGRR